MWNSSIFCHQNLMLYIISRVHNELLISNSYVWLATLVVWLATLIDLQYWLLMVKLYSGPCGKCYQSITLYCYCGKQSKESICAEEQKDSYSCGKGCSKYVRMYVRLDLFNLTYNVLTDIAVQLITTVNLTMIICV